ncbi:MAG: hypothetical protein AAAB35_11765 [Phyllobacterium sp.]|uniref:hypothetical protein n=1 Tax=Phyllobacterium sp. TaxID=1871046 RepID=UPI0030F19DF8
MRTFVVKSGQTLKDIGAELIDARVSKTQADAALKSIRALNPNIGTGKLSAGTVVIVPAGPGIRIGPTTAAKDDPAGILTAEFERAARETRDGVLASMKTRADERTEISAALKSDAFKRALEADKDLGVKAELAKKALSENEAADKQAAGLFDGLLSDARGALEKLDKLLG